MMPLAALASHVDAPIVATAAVQDSESGVPWEDHRKHPLQAHREILPYSDQDLATSGRDHEEEPTGTSLSSHEIFRLIKCHFIIGG